MVVNCNLSDNKSPQIPKTLLSILANLSNAVVWMVFHLFSLPFISKSSVLILWWLCWKRQLQLISPSSFFFSSLGRSRYSSLFSLSFSFTVWTAKFTIQQGFFFVVLVGRLFLLVWSSGRDSVIRLYLKILKNFVRLILLDGFRVEHMPFVSMGNILA